MGVASIDFEPMRLVRRAVLRPIINQDRIVPLRRKFLADLPRRAGKDKFAGHVQLWQALQKPCLVVYCSPNVYSMHRGNMGDGIRSSKVNPFCQ
jgi:hypothetical protein